LTDGNRLRLLFAGTPVFAERALDAILAAGHEVVGVLTQPDRPSGRGQKLTASAVKRRALAAGLDVLQPPTLRDPDVQRSLQALQPDVIVVAAYGLILPQSVLDLAPLGCLNIHASLLPRWRGAAPIVRAIQAGDSETGVCIMKMEAGLDTGPVAVTRTIPILPDDTAGSLHDRLAEIGADAICAALAVLRGVGTHPPLVFVPQPSVGVTYASKIEKSEARVDWRLGAHILSRHIRAFDPQPGAYTRLASQPDVALRVFQPEQVSQARSGQPGEVLEVGAQGLLVATGSGGMLSLGQLQRAGGRRLPVEEYLRGHPIRPGERLLPP
jgi:methionyl-tRNA formyltransferase